MNVCVFVYIDIYTHTYICLYCILTPCRYTMAMHQFPTHLSSFWWASDPCGLNISIFSLQKNGHCNIRRHGFRLIFDMTSAPNPAKTSLIYYNTIYIYINTSTNHHIYCFSKYINISGYIRCYDINIIYYNRIYHIYIYISTSVLYQFLPDEIDEIHGRRPPGCAWEPCDSWATASLSTCRHLASPAEKTIKALGKPWENGDLSIKHGDLLLVFSYS